MNQNFSKSKFLHESSKLEHFQWGVKIWGYKLGGGYKFWTSQKFRFPTIIIFVIFWTEGKIHQIALKRSMVISADIFAVLLRYF